MQATRYTSAAALYAAISAAMLEAPEQTEWRDVGPCRPEFLVLAYLLSGIAGSMKIRNTRPRLAAMLETVRKNWTLYGGGAKPAELAPVRKARAVWPAALVKLWREQIECREYSDALRIGQEQLGAVCFAVTGRAAFILAAPQPVDGLPAELVSAMRDDGKYVVTDLLSGVAIGARGANTRKTAEAEAVALWAGRTEEQQAAALKNARAVQTNKAGADAFAQWAAEHGIEQAIIEPAETAAAEQAETVTDAPQTAEQLRAEFVARGFDVVQVETVREVAPAADVLAISADVAIAADTLARLTSQAAHCADRRGAIESGIRGHVSALAYIVPALQRLQDFGRGLEKSEAARALRELAGAGLMAAPAVVEQAAPVAEVAADVATAVYTLPDGGRTYEDWAGSACRGYVPTARQQIVIDAVKSALTAGLFYTSDVFAHCVAVLSPSEEQLSIGRGRVENGEVGMDCADVGQPAQQIGAPVQADADSGRGIRWHKACADAIRGRREFWSMAGRAVYRPWDGRMGALQRTARPPAVREAGRGAVNPGRFAKPGAVPMRKTRRAARMSGPARARIDRRSFAGIGFSP